MSNQIIIRRHEVKNLDTGEIWKEAHIFDSYGNLDSVPMDILPINSLALFFKIIKEQIDHGYAGVDDTLRYLYEAKSGVTIAGEYLDYENIKAALKYYMES